ncbi:MAG TPA: Uma2 family endonuclease [Oscillatoriaceae cyanobacterium M7585_C2015_266]|nr:Uma2 family endonuclease [Oscillatoriaceae cyanobacterium M7585_C2015_266]
MSATTETRLSTIRNLEISWPVLPDDFILPDDPVEDTEHHPLAAALHDALSAVPELLQDALITTNFALCAGVNNRTICKALDWMYVRPVPAWPHYRPRRSYTPHTQGPVPLVVMEFLSTSDNDEYSMQFQPRIGKWFFYEQVIKVPTYVIFQPETALLEVYGLRSQHYQLQTPDANDRYWIPGLDLFLGVWQGRRNERTGAWLRWWNAAGELLLWPEERAEQERLRAEQERLRAEQERLRAEQERQRAEAAEQRAAQLAERLRQLGIEPDS